MRTIAIAGTFDSKGAEYQYIKGLVEELGLRAYTIHTGVFEPMFEPDVSNGEVAAAAGYNLEEIAAKKDRSLAMEALAKGMETIVPKLYADGMFDGILSLGGVRRNLSGDSGHARSADWCAEADGFHHGVWRCGKVCRNK